jgi:hypothetical protein
MDPQPSLELIKHRAITEAVMRRDDPFYDPEDGEASAWDKTVTPDVVLGLVYEIERLRGDGHQFTGTVKRADGVIITATVTIPDTHPMAKPGPHRPWHGAQQSNQNFIELGELAMMIAQQGYGIIERNERSRERWGKDDYWADLLNVEPPVFELEQ